MTALRYSVLSSFVLTNPAGNAKSNSRSMRAAVAFGARRRKAPCDDNVRFLKTAVLMRSFELPYLFGAGAAACLRQDAFAAKRLPIQGSAVGRKRTLIEASFPKRRTSRRPISHGGILSLWLMRRAVRRDFARRTATFAIVMPYFVLYNRYISNFCVSFYFNIGGRSCRGYLSTTNGG